MSYAALAPIVCVPHQHQWWSASVPRQQRATPRQLLQCTPHQPLLGSTSLRRQRGATHRQRPAPVTEKSSPAPVVSLQQSLRQFVEAQFGAQSVRSSMCRLSVCQLSMLSVKTSCQPAPGVVRSTQDQDHVAPFGVWSIQRVTGASINGFLYVSIQTCILIEPRQKFATPSQLLCTSWPSHGVLAGTHQSHSSDIIDVLLGRRDRA